MNFMGLLKGIGSGVKKAGGAAKGFLDDDEKMAKFGKIAQGFGQGAKAVNPDSQIGAAVGGVGKGMTHHAAQRMTPPDTYGGEKGANQPISQQMQQADVQFAQMPAPPMAPGGIPGQEPTDDGGWEFDPQVGSWKRKPGTTPLMY